MQIMQIQASYSIIYRKPLMWCHCVIKWHCCDTSRAGANSGPELELLANSNSNSGIGIGIELAFPSLTGIGIELELPVFELELNWNCHNLNWNWSRNCVLRNRIRNCFPWN